MTSNECERIANYGFEAVMSYVGLVKTSIMSNKEAHKYSIIWLTRDGKYARMEINDKDVAQVLYERSGNKERAKYLFDNCFEVFENIKEFEVAYAEQEMEEFKLRYAQRFSLQLKEIT